MVTVIGERSTMDGMITEHSDLLSTTLTGIALVCARNLGIDIFIVARSDHEAVLDIVGMERSGQPLDFASFPRLFEFRCNSGATTSSSLRREATNATCVRRPRRHRQEGKAGHERLEKQANIPFGLRSAKAIIWDDRAF